nr:septal ring lytic transglycosylase RlpA family protein [Pseudomarimonas arenosa]
MNKGTTRGLIALICLVLIACSGQPKRASHPLPNKPPRSGELYAPHIRDGGPPVPPEISRIPEPIPVPEPRARYGNRSPYTVLGKTYRVMDSAKGYRERGIASWYGNKFHGRPTSSFEPYDMYKFTAAHKTLPLPSFVRVVNLDNGRSVVVRVNDRGPFHDGRIIDLSYAAAVRLGMHLKGTASVEVEAIDPSDRRMAQQAPPLHRSAMPAPSRGGGHGSNSAGGSDRRFLQIASFAEKDNAKRLQQRLQDAGVDGVKLVAARVGNQRVWRVRLGPYQAWSEIEQAKQALRGMGLGEPQLVPE